MCMYVCMNGCMCVYVCLYERMYVCMKGCMCVDICMHANGLYMHTSIYIFIVCIWMDVGPFAKGVAICIPTSTLCWFFVPIYIT